MLASAAAWLSLVVSHGVESGSSCDGRHCWPPTNILHACFRHRRPLLLPQLLFLACRHLQELCSLPHAAPSAAPGATADNMSTWLSQQAHPLVSSSPGSDSTRCINCVSGSTRPKLLSFWPSTRVLSRALYFGSELSDLMSWPAC